MACELGGVVSVLTETGAGAPAWLEPGAGELALGTATGAAHPNTSAVRAT
jgi:hypothetical protein